MQRRSVVLSFFAAVLTMLFVAVAPATAQEVKGADFVVNVWDMGTLPEEQKNLVLKAKNCKDSFFQKCRSSAIIGGPLRKCADAGACKRAEKPITLNITFSLKPELDGDYQIVGKKNFLVPYGTKVTAKVVDGKVEIPVESTVPYTLEPSEWALDKNIAPGDVARLHGHWVLSAQ